MNLIQLPHLLRKGGSLIAFVCAGPHIAERALNEGRAIPPEAGFMGRVTSWYIRGAAGASFHSIRPQLAANGCCMAEYRAIAFIFDGY